MKITFVLKDFKLLSHNDLNVKNISAVFLTEAWWIICIKKYRQNHENAWYIDKTS